MREIKFRLWHKELKQMIRHEDLDFNSIFDQLIRDVFVNKLTQYTGLNDKNGKEIYEGDIVRFTWHSVLCSSEKPIDRRYEVVYIDGGFRQADTYGSIGNWYKWDEVEIIGNIYENECLLAKG